MSAEERNIQNLATSLVKLLTFCWKWHDLYRILAQWISPNMFHFFNPVARASQKKNIEHTSKVRML